MNLVEKFEETVARHPDKVALDFEKQKYTFSRLDREINQFAHRLIDGVYLGKDEKVAVLLKNSPEFIVSVWAALKSAAVAVPINVFLTGEEIAYILNDCRARILITSPSFAGELIAVRDRLSVLEKIIVCGPPGGRGEGTPDELTRAFGASRLVSYPEFIARAAAGAISRDRSDQDVACLIYTSGTMGKPKGVMLTHANFLANVDQSVRAIGIEPRDSFLTVLPLFHSFTLTVCVFIPLLLGGRIVLVRALLPFKNVVKAALFQRPTIFVGVPQIFNLLARRKLPRVFSLLLRVRICVSGSAPLPVETLGNFEKNFRIPLLEGYGLTEAAPVVSVNPRRGVRKAGSVGRPLPGVEIKIVDDDVRELEAGESGEIIVRGRNVMRGYYQLPAATNETIRDGWLFTGDIGKLDEDGYLYIVDRKKDLILVKGLNVYPREVEEVLYRHPKIREAAVVGQPDPHKGEVPVAVCVAQEGCELDPLELIRFCRGHLAQYKIPRRVIFLPELPKTATGKILKREVRRLLREGKIADRP